MSQKHAEVVEQLVIVALLYGSNNPHEALRWALARQRPIGATDECAIKLEEMLRRTMVVLKEIPE